MAQRLVGTRVVDERGRPIPVAHFTPNMEFEVFQEGDTGFHFGSELQAQGRAKDKGGVGRTIRAYLNIQSPIRVSSDIMNWKAAPLAMKLYTDNLLSEKEYQYISGLASQGQEYHSPAAAELRRLLKEKGYDGVVYPNGYEGEGDSYIAFYPQQVQIVDDGRGGEDHRPLGADTAGPRPTAEELSETYGNIPKGEHPARDAQIPRQSPEGPTSRFARTAGEAAQLTDEMAATLREEVANGTFAYTVHTNQYANAQANDRIEEMGFDNAITFFREKFRSGERMGKNDIALGERLIQLAAEQKDAELVLRLTADVAALGTELGQAVQALSMLKRMGPQGRLLVLQRQVQRINQENAQRIEKNAQGNQEQLQQLEADRADARQQGNEQMVAQLERTIAKLKGEVQISPETAADILSQTDEAGLDAALERAYVALAEQMPANWMDKWNALRYMSMLTNPTTHIQNILGNAIFYPVVQLKNALKLPLEQALMPKMQLSGDYTAAVLNPANAIDQGYLKLAGESYRANRKLLQSGGKYNPSNVVQDHRRIFKTEVLEYLRKKNGGALEREDSWFLQAHYTTAYAQYLKANGYDTATSERRTELLEGARSWASEEAWRGTYRDASNLADALNRFAKTNLATQFLVEGILPFKKTPVNILKRGVNYSPLGAVTGVYRLLTEVKTGKTDATHAIDQLASGLTGTGVLALGYLLASMGLLSGKGEKDKKARTYRRQRTGWQPYSLTLGDSSYTLDWMAPMSLPLFIGVSLQEQLREGSGASLVQAGWDGLLALTEPMVEMSMLSGLDRAIQSAGYAGGGSGNALTAFASSAVESYLGQVFPTFGGRINRILDGTQRNTYYKDKTSALPGELQTAMRSSLLQKAVPGGSKLIEPKLDAWGNEQKEGLGERVVENLLSPGYYSQSKATAVDEELLRLYTAVGENRVLPDTNPGKAVTAGGQRKDLSAQEYTQYTRARGQAAYSGIEQLMQQPGYLQMDDSSKADLVADVYSYAAEVGKKTVLPSYTSKTLERAEELKQAGVEYPAYLLMKEQGDLDQSGTLTQEEVKFYLDRSGLSRRQKAALWGSANSGWKKNPYN